ncbi:hypothetical protein ACQPWW_25770 [Micromonospora sp. CA-240977]|uniref:hypothetical protein n=1 Tax=Micromonospora sp. CA-240977 TaxID=3239957 RepID=UPI003D92D998
MGREFLEALAEHARTAVAESAEVRLLGQGAKTVVDVVPADEASCRFSVFLQDDDELTIEFGEMSVLDFHGESSDELREACREVVDAILGGRVTEAVYVRDGVPVRALAHIEVPDRTITVRTRQGLKPFARKARVRQYLPYGPGQG